MICLWKEEIGFALLTVCSIYIAAESYVNYLLLFKKYVTFHTRLFT